MSVAQLGQAGARMRIVLVADAAVEATCGLALLAWREEFRTWLGLGEPVVLVLAAVFVLAAAVPAALLLVDPQSSAMKSLAWANVAGGSAGWLALPFIWSGLEPEGRWILAAAFDTFILTGVAQLIELRCLRG